MTTYSVSIKIVLQIDLQVEAQSIQLALDKGHDLKLEDFIKIKGSYIDGPAPEIIGVYSQEDL